MPDIDLPAALVDVQRRCDAAWAAVEAHRAAVDAARRAEGVPVKDAPKWVPPTLKEWTAEEDAEHARLMAEVTAAAEARHAALTASGLGAGYDVVQALHKAARA
jgi:hypothetical protein